MSIRVAFLAGVLILSPAYGQATQADEAASPGPATLPTTLPTTAPSATGDATTPRGAMKAFFAARVYHDGAALREVLAGTNAAEEHMIAANADRLDADRQLTDALRDKFPGSVPAAAVIRAAADAQLVKVDAGIDRADEKIDGDTATLKAENSAGRPVTLTRVGGKWRLPLAVVDADAGGALEQKAHQIDIQVAVMRQAAADVASGKYATAREAQDEVKGRMYSAALADHNAHKAETQPNP